MLQVGSIIYIEDSSGVKTVSVIRCLGGSNRKTSKVGDFVIASVKSVKPNFSIKKGDIVKVCINLTKKAFLRKDGTFVRSSENTGTICFFNKKNYLISKPSSPILAEFVEKGVFHKEIVSKSSEVL